MPLRSSITSPESEIQGIIDNYRSQGIGDDQIEKRLAESYAASAYEGLLYPEKKEEETFGVDLEEMIGPRPEPPVYPEDSYLQFKREFYNPTVEPLRRRGYGSGFLPGEVENYETSSQARRERWNQSIKNINSYNDAVTEYNYNEREWVGAANEIIKQTADEKLRSVYEESIKTPEPVSAILEIPDRPNPYSWNSALGEVRNSGKFSPFDFGVHEFYSMTDEEFNEMMVNDPTYQKMMSEKMAFTPERTGISNISYVPPQSPDDILNSEPGTYSLPGGREIGLGYEKDSDIYQQALQEKARRTEQWKSQYQREWFSKYAKENTFAGFIDQMTPEELAQAEEDIFNDTGLYINLDGNNVVGVEKEGDFWRTVEIGANKLKSQVDGLLLAGEAASKKVASLTGASDETLAGYDERIDALRQSREDLESKSNDLRSANTKYYLTREQARMLGENSSLELEDEIDNDFFAVLRAISGFDDAFSKHERLEAIESAPTSVTAQGVGAAVAIATRGRGKKVKNVFDFMAKMAPGTGATMGGLVGGDKFAELYDDPYFSTFTDENGNLVSPMDASLRLASARSEGEGTETYESIGLTRDRNDWAIAGYSAWDGGSEVVGEVAGGWLFGKLGKYVAGKPLSSVGRTRIKQYLGGMAAAAGVSIPEEYMEEWLTEVLQYAGDVVAKGGQFNLNEMIDLAHDAGLTGAVMGPLLGTAGGTVSSVQSEVFARTQPEQFTQYQLRFAFNGVLDRMTEDEKNLLKVREARKGAIDPTFIRQLDIQADQISQRISEYKKARVQKAEDLAQRDVALANEILAVNTQADFLARKIDKATQEGRDQEAEMMKEALAQTIERRQELDDRVADVLTMGYTAGPLKDGSGAETDTEFTSRPSTQEETQESRGMAAASRSPEDAALQDMAEEEIDLKAEAELEADYMQVQADMLGGLLENGAINEAEMAEGVMDLVRAVGSDSKNTIITVFGSDAAFEKDPAIQSYMSQSEEKVAPDAYVAKRPDGTYNILIKPGSSLGDVQHEIGHTALRDIYDNESSRSGLVNKIEKWSNRKGNEVFKAWVESTKELYSSENQQVQEEELIQNFLQGFVSGEWKVYENQQRGIEVNKSQYDALVDLFWTYVTRNNPAAKNLRIKDKDGLIAVARKFEKYVTLPEADPNAEQGVDQLVKPSEAAAPPEEAVEEAPKEKLDPASLFKPTEVMGVKEQPKAEPAPAPEVAKEAVKEAIAKPVEGRKETESEAEYQARLEKEADALLAGAEGVSTPETDVLSQATEDIATTPGLASKPRRKDFISGKKVVGVYVNGFGYPRTFEMIPNDYFHFRNWYNKITGNNVQPFNSLYWVDEQNQKHDLKAPKQRLDKQGNPVTMKPVDIRTALRKFAHAKEAIATSRKGAIQETSARKDAIVQKAKENGISLEEIGLKGPYPGSDTYEEIEAAEVKLMAKISQEPGAVYDLGDISLQRPDWLSMTPKTYEDLQKGRERGYAARSRRKLTGDGLSDNSKSGESWGFTPAVDMKQAEQFNLIQHVKNFGELKKIIGDRFYVTEVKYAPTDTGEINLEYFNDAGHLSTLKLESPGGILTPIADVFRYIEENDQVPGSLDVTALSFTGESQRTDMLKAARSAQKLRMPMVVIVKQLAQENSLGDPTVFSNAFKIAEEVLANSSRNEKVFSDFVTALNLALTSEYPIETALGKESEFTSAALYTKLGLSKEEEIKTLGFKTVENEDGSTGLIIDTEQSRLGFKNFRKFFANAQAENNLGFYRRQIVLNKMFSSGRSGENRVNLNDPQFRNAGFPSKEDFLSMHNLSSQSEAASASKKSPNFGDVVGAYVIDPANVKPRDISDSKRERSYTIGVSGLTTTGDFAPLYLFNEFDLESEIEEHFQPIGRGDFRKRVGQPKGEIAEKVEKTILKTGKITGSERAQGKGLEGLASRNRAGRIYHHGAGQWEKSDANYFGKALSAIALKLQDKYFDVIMLQSDVENYKNQRSESSQDFDLALDLMYGKTRRDLDMLEESLDMIKDLMSRSNITSDQLSDYLYALHVPERNKYVENKNGIKNGSGQSNKWAEDKISELESPNMKRLATLVHSIVENTRKTMVDFGLETEETIKAWKGLFDNYVPLAGLAEDEMDENNIAYPTGGAGMSVYGSTQKKIIGRKSEVGVNIVAQVVMQNAMVHQVARKNEALKHLYNLIKQNPNQSVWGINSSKFPLTRLGESGEQESMTVAEMKINPHTVPIRIDGATEFLYFRDKNYANTLNGMTVERAGVFTRALNSLTGFMRNMLTIYDPNFMISNYSRDIQGAMYNALAESERTDGYIEGLNKAQFAADMMKNIFASTKSLFGQAAFGLDMSEKMEMYKADWEEDGGKTGWGFTKNLDDIVAELEEASKSTDNQSSREFDIIMGSPKRFASYVEGINEAFEMSIRLASYMTAREKGISRERAAQLSKNITVNFNRGGELQFLNSVYLFFNAAMQGNSRILRSMFYLNDVRKANGELESFHKRVSTPQKVAFAMASFSGLVSLLNIAMSGADPDDGELWYNKIPDYEKERNMIFMHRDGKNYTKLPLPYGYNIFNNMGTVLAETSTGNRGMWDGAMFLGMSAFSAFSPIGFGQSKNIGTYTIKAGAPTALKPLVEIGANETYFGSQVYQERLPFATTPYSELAYRSPEDLQEFFRWMNEASGGSKYVSGDYDYNPDMLWYMYEYYIGSAGRFVGNTGELATNMYEMSKNSYRNAAEKGLSFEAFKELTSGFQGDQKIKMHPNEIPLVRKVFGEPSKYFDYDKFTENSMKIKQLQKELKDGPVYEPGRYVGVQDLYELLKETNETLSFIRKQRRGARDIEDLTKKTNLIYELDERERRVMTIFNANYERLRGTQEN